MVSYCKLATFFRLFKAKIFKIKSPLARGEPLIREEIDEWINYAKLKGVQVAVNSNGHFVPAYIQKIKNLDLLILSLE